jgi:hypothetical protein
MVRRRKSKRVQSKGFLSKIPTELKIFGSAMLYNSVIRQPTENLVKSLTNSAGLNLTDNMVRIGTAVAGRRLIKNKHVKRMFDTALYSEGANTNIGNLSSLFGMGQQQSQDNTQSNGATFN